MQQKLVDFFNGDTKKQKDISENSLSPHYGTQQILKERLTIAAQEIRLNEYDIRYLTYMT